jgi:hypothetical protein
MRNGRFGIQIGAAIGKRIGGDVDDTHDQRAFERKTIVTAMEHFGKIGSGEVEKTKSPQGVPAGWEV